MNSTERVRNAILGKEVDRQPIYCWVAECTMPSITNKWAKVSDFEDQYEFDMAHIFGGPDSIKRDLVEKIKAENDELTPDLLVDEDIFTDPSDISLYDDIKSAIEYHKKHNRFCYVQTPGFFEHFNLVFGIENQLMYLALYPDELGELYKKQARWTKKFAEICISLGADMIHVSDDWGTQRDIMFSPKTWYNLIYPNLKDVADFVHSKGALISLHSDGCIMKIVDGLVEIGMDCLHPWQENAGMSHDVYLEKYSDKFAILGGVCVQSTLGIVDQEKLTSEIRRVFNNLKGKRWICCTSHFVQSHCTVEDLTCAYDLIYKLARE